LSILISSTTDIYSHVADKSKISSLKFMQNRQKVFLEKIVKKEEK